MGSIISSKVRDDGKMIFEICVDSKEAFQLQGQVDNISLVASNLKKNEGKVVQRGTNEATMYFLIPKNERENLKNKDITGFQKIKTQGNTLYVYSIKNE